MAEEKTKKTNNTKANKTSQNRSSKKGQTQSRNRNGKNNNRNNNAKKGNTVRTTKPQAKKRPTPKKKVSEVKQPKETKNVEVVKEEQNTVEKPKTAKKIIPFEPEVEEEIVEETIVEIEVPEEKVKEDKLEKTLIFDGTRNKNLNDVVDKLEEDNIVLDDKIIKRSPAKKCAIIVLVIAILAIIVATTVYVVDYTINETSPRQTLNSNIYKNVSKTIKRKGKLSSNSNSGIEETEYSNIKTISLKELEDKLVNKENMSVLVASTNCYHCITFEPLLNEVFSENNKTIYRLNVINLSNEEMNRFRTYYSFTKTPTLFKVEDGYVTAELIGTATKEELTKWINNK